jgi:hypothetical protein
MKFNLGRFVTKTQNITLSLFLISLSIGLLSFCFVVISNLIKYIK